VMSPRKMRYELGATHSDRVHGFFGLDSQIFLSRTCRPGRCLAYFGGVFNSPSKLALRQLAPWKFAPWTACPLNSSPHGQLTQWTGRPMDNSLHGQLAPWTTFPMDNSSHGGSLDYSDDSTSKTCTKHRTYVYCQKNSEKFLNIFYLSVPKDS
jgi:hypothetical protein